MIFGEEKRYMKNNNLLFVICTIVILCSDAFAWNAEFTHRDLSQSAAEHSILNTGLLGDIGFVKGLADEKLGWDGQKLSITDWFRNGALLEDEGGTFSGRFYNHFHNPLYSYNQWGDAGLTSVWPWVNSGNSAVLWAADDSSNDWRWGRVRDYYYNALTSSVDADRQASFAQTFRGLGQVIHLLQDMAQPAHVRNDPHPADDKGVAPGFEYWAKRTDKKLTVTTLMAHPIYPTDSMNTTSSGYPPISQFFDTDQYNGTNPSSSLSLGLAEYTNANFVSEDTIFKDFAYPRREDTVVFAESQNKTLNGFEVYRKYFEKVGGGQSIKHFTTASRLYAYLLNDPSPSLQGFDDHCYKDYADLLIPRAVGYSAALINYFFRGQMDILPASGGLRVRNSGSEEMTYYADSSGHQIGQISIYYDDIDKIRHPLATYELLVSLAPGETTSVIPFSPPSNNIEPGRYIVVFQGKLGQEEGAVIGKVTSPSRLYYVSVRSGIYKIYSMKTDGSTPVVVYDNLDSSLKIGKLTFSPDGKTLAFTVNGPKIYLLNIATGGLTYLTNGGWPAWSPDGKKIAFSREMGRFSPLADEHIFIREVGTGVETQLTDSTASAYNSTPAWSPDGGKIAYMKFDPAGDNCANIDAIYLMDSAGNPIGPLTCGATNYKDETPAWSPDGSEIAFARGQEGHYSQLHKVKVATLEVTKLTDSTGDNYAEFTPSWFPERGKIAVGSNIDGDFDIWLVDSDGSGYIENLTDFNPDIDGYPVFEP